MNLITKSILVAAAFVPLAACATSRTETRSGAERFQGGVGDAVAAPLQDLNLRREEIPQVLLDARYRPYSLTNMSSCDAIAAELTRLQDTLGPDFDSREQRPGDTMGQSAADLALGAVRDTTTDIIPFRSWVRRLSGAQAYSQEVELAYQAGVARRGYLKGVGQRMGCSPPAAPRPSATQS